MDALMRRTWINVGLGLFAVVLGVAGLAIGVVTVPRWVEAALFGVCALLGLVSVLLSLRPVPARLAGEKMLLRRTWRLLRLALLAVAAALAVAGIRPDTAQERLDSLRREQQQRLELREEARRDRARVEQVSLTPSDERRLRRLARELRGDGNSAAAAAVSALAGAAGGIGGGLLTQSLATLRAAGPAGLRAAGDVLRIVGSRGALRLAPNVRIDHPTLTVERPTFALGGLHLHRGGSPPSTTKNVIQVKQPLLSLGTLRLRVRYRNVTYRRSTLPETP